MIARAFCRNARPSSVGSRRRVVRRSSVLHLLLEPAERTARRRHGQVKLLRGRRDRSRVDHDRECLQFVERDFHA